MNTNNQFDPDQLLLKISKSVLGPAIAVSLAAHLVIIGLTSFGLYRDWVKFGISCEKHSLHTPSIINLHKKELQKEKDDAERKAKLEQEADAKLRQEAAAATNAAPAKASAPAKAVPANDDKQVTPPEVAPMSPASLDSVDFDAL